MNNVSRRDLKHHSYRTETYMRHMLINASYLGAESLSIDLTQQTRHDLIVTMPIFMLDIRPPPTPYPQKY